jgi:hypothetical protein
MQLGADRSEPARPEARVSEPSRRLGVNDVGAFPDQRPHPHPNTVRRNLLRLARDEGLRQLGKAADDVRDRERRTRAR